jgi:hypothetical protein
MRGRIKKRGVADHNLCFKSGRSGSKMGPYSQLRGHLLEEDNRPQQLLAGATLHSGNTLWKN